MTSLELKIKWLKSKIQRNSYILNTQINLKNLSDDEIEKFKEYLNEYYYYTPTDKKGVYIIKQDFPF